MPEESQAEVQAFVAEAAGCSERVLRGRLQGACRIIQQQADEIERLRARVGEQDAEIARLQRRVDELEGKPMCYRR